MKVNPGTIVLNGCSPTPISSYLKAIGIMRILSEQIDPGMRACWNESDRFIIETSLSHSEIVDFFLTNYNPSPLFDPWNGGSGFFKRVDKQTGKRVNSTKATQVVEAVISATTPRLERSRVIMKMIGDILSRSGIESSPSEDKKKELIMILRASLPDYALDWLDASILVSGTSTSYPALLGTGGNDGNLDFANNYYQRLKELFSFDTGEPSPGSENWLESALSGEATAGLVRNVAMGQFNPGMTGGVNATAGFEDASVVNPWEYVFMLEGTLLFSAAASRRLTAGNIDRFTYPFTVRPVRAGYSSSSSMEDIRSEMWLPLWGNPASISEISCLFSEGRATVGSRNASDGLDFARAVASMGVDRGISQFERYSFILRNGRSYFATPIGRFDVHSDAKVELIDELKPWLDRMKSASSNGPGSVLAASRKIENRILELCISGSDMALYRLFLEMGRAERAVVRSGIWKDSPYLNPLVLRSSQWIEKTYDGSAEYRLAASIASCWSKASGSVRYLIEPLNRQSVFPGFSKDRKNAGLWHGSLVDGMISLLSRMLIEAEKGDIKTYPVHGRFPAMLDDIALFLDENVNYRKIRELVNSLMLMSWYNYSGSCPWEDRIPSEVKPSGAWSLLKLVYLRTPPYGIVIPVDRAILRLASSGKLNGAVKKAANRLRGSGLTPVFRKAAGSSALSGRIAAALLFPLSQRNIYRIMKSVITLKSLETTGKEN